MLRIRAGWVHPVTAPPIPDGAVLVDGAGRIAAVGPHSHVPTSPAVESLEFPDARVVPGLVNCHTHLELTHLAGQNEEREFPRWIRRVRQLKAATTPEQFTRAAEQGVREAWAAGVTCVADTGSTGAPLEALARLGGRGVAYQEVFGPDPAQCGSSLTELDAALGRLRPRVSSRVRLGVSPHAPYTVSPPLYRAVVDRARRDGLPLALHLAESPEETRFVRDGEGPFADLLRGRGIPVEPRHCSPVAYLAELDVLGSDVLAIHCVHLSEEDIGRLKTEDVAIAHCPLSNRAHGHGTAPLAALRAAGVRVGLGTDSIVSVGRIDLWAEAAAAGFSGEEALRMLTLEGARALGWESEIGSLEVGKAADLAVLSANHARLTLVAGRVVHRTPPHE